MYMGDVLVCGDQNRTLVPLKLELYVNEGHLSECWDPYSGLLEELEVSMHMEAEVNIKPTSVALHIF